MNQIVINDTTMVNVSKRDSRNQGVISLVKERSTRDADGKIVNAGRLEVFVETPAGKKVPLRLVDCNSAYQVRVENWQDMEALHKDFVNQCLPCGLVAETE